MTTESESLTNLNPLIVQVQNARRASFVEQNKTAKKGQIVFVGSSLMEIFPIEDMQKSLGLNKVIYNRGIRATTTADLLAAMDLCIFDLAPSKISGLSLRWVKTAQKSNRNTVLNHSEL